MNKLINLGIKVNYFIDTNFTVLLSYTFRFFLCHIQYNKIIVVL